SQAVRSGLVSMSSMDLFDTSSVVRLRSPSWPTPAALNGATFPPTLSTPALDRRTLWWFVASPCRAATEDHWPHSASPSISDAAPHQAARSSTSASLLRSCSHSARGPGSVTAVVLQHERFC